MSVDCEVIDSNFTGYVCKFPKKEKKKNKTKLQASPNGFIYYALECCSLHSQ